MAVATTDSLSEAIPIFIGLPAARRRSPRVGGVRPSSFARDL